MVSFVCRMLIATSKIKEKKSTFHGYLFEAKDVDSILSELKSKHAKAAHLCYALRNGEDSFKNDGEVGHPGRRLLELLKDHDLDNHLLVVVRYFGGVKLGPGGVGRAFKAAGKACLEQF